MIKTSIMLGLDEGFPIMHKSAGFAKSLPIARWLFNYCGWEREDGREFPDLCYQVEVIEWPEGDEYFPCDMTLLFVLENKLIMN